MQVKQVALDTRRIPQPVMLRLSLVKSLILLQMRQYAIDTFSCSVYPSTATHALSRLYFRSSIDCGPNASVTESPDFWASRIVEDGGMGITNATEIVESC